MCQKKEVKFQRNCKTWKNLYRSQSSLPQFISIGLKSAPHFFCFLLGGGEGGRVAQEDIKIVRFKMPMPEISIHHFLQLRVLPQFPLSMLPDI